MHLYFVVLYETFAFVGRAPPGPDPIPWIESRVAETPEWEGEHVRGWSHGARDVLQRQFRWLTGDILEECDWNPALQQQVWYEESE